MSAQYLFYLTVQLGCPLPVRDNLNKYVYSTTRIGDISYMEPGPAQAEIVYVVLYRLALFPREITVNYSAQSSVGDGEVGGIKVSEWGSQVIPLCVEVCTHKKLVTPNYSYCLINEQRP